MNAADIPPLPSFERDDDAAPAAVREAASAMGPLGIETVRASVVDIESMACESSWRITGAGELTEQPLADGSSDSFFPTAMATIVHLNHSSAEQTLARKLDANRWGFAWRLDERHVAVADVSYSHPHSAHTPQETALMRRLCRATIPGVETTLDVRSMPAANEQRLQPPNAAPAAPEAAAAERPRRRRFRGASLRSAVLWLLPLYLLTAAFVYTGYHHRLLTEEAVRLQGMTETTMRQRLSNTLAGGDWGEVQDELDVFAALKYFERAVVTGPGGKVVAMTETARPLVRIGDRLTPDLTASGRALELGRPGAPHTGELYLWGVASDASLTAQPWTSVVALLVCAAVTIVTAMLLRGSDEDDRLTAA